MRSWSRLNFFLLVFCLIRPETEAFPGDLIQTARVTRRDFSKSVTGYGHLKSLQRDDIPASTEGIIKKVWAKNGDKVARGEKILQLQGKVSFPEMSLLQSRLKRAEIALDRQKREYERINRMEAAGAAYEKEKEQAFAAYQAALADLRAARQTSDYYTGGVIITSPGDGYVVSLSGSPGNLIGAGDLLFSTVDLRNLMAEVEILSGEGASMKPGDEATITAGHGHFPGKVAFVSPRVNPATGKIKVGVRIELKKPGSPLPGDFIKADIITEKHSSFLALPRRALLNDGGETVVIVKTGNTYEKRAVVTGFQNRDQVEILQGLRIGEEVVTRGAYELLNRGIEKKIKIED